MLKCLNLQLLVLLPDSGSKTKNIHWRLTLLRMKARSQQLNLVLARFWWLFWVMFAFTGFTGVSASYSQPS